MRVLAVFGTRPEAIKFVPVCHAFAEAEDVELTVCVTAQHRHMLDQVMSLAEITPDIDLNVMRDDQTLTGITTAVLEAMPAIFEKVKPDCVLVQGDTTTSFAASLAAFYARIPVGHIEAGLRSGDLYAPWPEEFNRRVTSLVTRWHFAPTESAASHLIKEGITASRIYVTGNTVIDALHYFLAKIDEDVSLSTELAKQFSFLDENKRTILVTSHRRENFDGGIERICDALSYLAKRGDVQIVFPVHPNPHVREPVEAALGKHPDVMLIEPQDYLPFIYLMRRANLIISDSGGIQEEAPALGKPVLVMRSTTERPEGVQAGTAKLVGTSSDLIIQEANQLLDDQDAYDAMSRAHNPFGDGKATTRILAALRAKR